MHGVTWASFSLRARSTWSHVCPGNPRFFTLTRSSTLYCLSLFELKRCRRHIQHYCMWILPPTLADPLFLRELLSSKASFMHGCRNRRHLFVEPLLPPRSKAHESCMSYKRSSCRFVWVSSSIMSKWRWQSKSSFRLQCWGLSGRGSHTCLSELPRSILIRS